MRGKSSRDKRNKSSSAKRAGHVLASDVVRPVSIAERVSAGVPLEQNFPAKVPSVFHQRVQFLTFETFHSLLVGLFRLLAQSPETIAIGDGAGGLQQQISDGSAAVQIHFGSTLRAPTEVFRKRAKWSQAQVETLNSSSY